MRCKICNKDCGLFAQRHHRFSQSKANRRLYGDLIDDPKNIIYPVCGGCNVSHAAGFKLPKWTELEFCRRLGIEPQSKDAQMRKARAEIYRYQ